MNKENSTLAEVIHTRWLSPLVAGVSLVVSLVFSVKNQNLAERTKELENKQTELKTDILKKEFDNNLKMKIFEEVRRASSTSISLNEQNVVKTMVTDMLADFPLYRDNLLELLQKSAVIDTSIKQQTKKLLQEESKYQAEQQTIETPPATGKVRLDIFYVETADADTRGKANALKSLIDQKLPARYQTRVRMLPQSVNAQSGYRITGNQLRYEKEEEKYATEILNLPGVNNMLASSLTLHQIQYNTPSYISLFITDK